MTTRQRIQRDAGNNKARKPWLTPELAVLPAEAAENGANGVIFDGHFSSGS